MIHSAVTTTSPASQKALSDWGSFAVRVCITIGYPLVAIVSVYVNAQPQQLSIPYRIFVVGLALTTLGGVLGGRRRRPIAGLLIAFSFCYLCRLFYDWQFADIAGADLALASFVGIVLVPGVAATIAGTKNFSDVLFARSVLGVGLVVVAACLALFFAGKGYNAYAEAGIAATRLGFEPLSPISVGMCAGTVILSAIFFLLDAPRGIFWKVGAAIGLGLGSWVLLLANSRGPIIACVVAVTWFLAARWKRTVLFSPILFLLLFFVPIGTDLFTSVSQRFAGDYASDTGRLATQQSALQAFFDNPAFGSFYLDPALGSGNYPHNFLFETAMSLGLLGLVLMAAILYKSASNVVSGLGRSNALLCMLMIQQLIYASISGALWDNDAFFMMLGITLSASNNRSARPRAVAAPRTGNQTQIGLS